MGCKGQAAKREIEREICDALLAVGTEDATRASRPLKIPRC